VLRDSFWWSTNGLNSGFYEVRNNMNLRFLNHLIVGYIRRSMGTARVNPPAIPDTTNVVARKDLSKSARFYVANFNKP
jgi:hypothetical protein